LDPSLAPEPRLLTRLAAGSSERRFSGFDRPRGQFARDQVQRVAILPDERDAPLRRDGTRAREPACAQDLVLELAPVCATDEVFVDLDVAARQGTRADALPALHVSPRVRCARGALWRLALAPFDAPSRTRSDHRRRGHD